VPAERVPCARAAPVLARLELAPLEPAPLEPERPELAPPELAPPREAPGPAAPDRARLPVARAGPPAAGNALPATGSSSKIMPRSSPSSSPYSGTSRPASACPPRERAEPPLGARVAMMTNVARTPAAPGDPGSGRRVARTGILPPNRGSQALAGRPPAEDAERTIPHVAGTHHDDGALLPGGAGTPGTGRGAGRRGRRPLRPEVVGRPGGRPGRTAGRYPRAACPSGAIR
jgi:hypothetical protein